MGILKREVYYDDTGGLVRFWDWALTTTTLGVMAEPFNPNDRLRIDGVSEFDPTDDMARIDSLRAQTVDRQPQILSGGNDALIGGPLNPRNNAR